MLLMYVEFYNILQIAILGIIHKMEHFYESN